MARKENAMSQPNGDPPSQSPTPPIDPFVSQHVSPDTSDAPRPAGPSPLTPVPRANPPSVFNQKETPAPAPAAEPGFNDFLAWMASRAGDQSPAPPAPVSAPRTTLPREQKKFHRADAETKADKRWSSADSAGAGFAGTAKPADASASAGLPVIRKRRKSTADGGRFEEMRRLLMPPMMLLALVVGGFALGRRTAPKSSAVTVAPVAKIQSDKAGPQSARIAELIDYAMTAETKGDFKGARDFLEQVQALGSHAAGLNYHLALLAFEDGDLPRAMTLLDQNIEKAEDSAASYNLRGILVNRTGGINHGLDNLEAATRFDPFNARYFFFLGEALRRSGKPQQALVRLREAVDRLREPPLEGIYKLKLRLTQIELGLESEFATQLADELARTPPPIDWLFTAAALEMHRGHFDTAAAFLDKASTVADPREVNSRLRDFYFFGFAHEKPLARFFAANSNREAAHPPSAPAPAANSITALVPPAPPNAATSPTPGVPFEP